MDCTSYRNCYTSSFLGHFLLFMEDISTTRYIITNNFLFFLHCVQNLMDNFMNEYTLLLQNKTGDVQRREEKHLLELTTPDRLLDADELENDGNARHNIKVFSFASIAAATNNFSPETKLGEGGFGPVYKVCFQKKIFFKKILRCLLAYD